MSEADQYLILGGLVIALIALFVISARIPTSPPSNQFEEPRSRDNPVNQRLGSVSNSIKDNDPQLRSWGIVALSVVMFLNVALGGAKGSPYAAFWLYSAYLAYKGRVGTLRVWLKALAIINFVGIIGVALFADERTIRLIFPFLNSHIELLIATSIPLLVKLGLIYWIDRRIAASNHADSVKGNQRESVTNESTIGNSFNPQWIKSGCDGVQSTASFTPKASDWESALIEYEGPNRSKGLWARLYAENNGNEELVKAAYLRVRANEFACTTSAGPAKHGQSNMDRQRARSYSDEKCMLENLYDEIQIYDYKVQHLYNGHAVINTPIRAIIYRSIDAAEEALANNKRSGYFSDDGMIKQIKKF